MTVVEAHRVEPLPVDDVAATAAETFTAAFGSTPDGVWVAPGRANLIGEHIDYAGGRVLPFALPYVTAAAVAARTDGILRCVSTHTDEVWEGSVSTIAPGSPTGWPAYVAGVVWAMRRRDLVDARSGFDIAIASSVPVGSGLSSSAALECSVALAVSDLEGIPSDRDEDRLGLVASCIRAENEIAGASTGGMDQSVALLADAGHALLLDCRTWEHHLIPLDVSAAGFRILLVDSNAPHQLAGSAYADRRASIDAACAVLGVQSLREIDDTSAALAVLDDATLVRRARHVLTEMARVSDTIAALAAGRHDEVGAALTASHTSLRDDYEVTTPALDTIVDEAVAAGATGARMIGGGFGGSAIVLCAEHVVDAVIEHIVTALSDNGFDAPTFYTAPPSASAHRVR